MTLQLQDSDTNTISFLYQTDRVHLMLSLFALALRVFSDSLDSGFFEAPAE
jgi:hypothetical protein